MIGRFFGGPLDGQVRDLEDQNGVVTCETFALSDQRGGPDAPPVTRTHRYVLDRDDEYAYRLPSDTMRHYVWWPLWATRERPGKGASGG